MTSHHIEFGLDTPVYVTVDRSPATSSSPIVSGVPAVWLRVTPSRRSGKAAGVSRQTASAWLKRHRLQANHRPHERPTVDQLAADYKRTRSIRKLAGEYGISSAVMRTWLFEAGVDPLGVPGRPSRDISVDEVRARRAR